MVVSTEVAVACSEIANLCKGLRLTCGPTDTLRYHDVAVLVQRINARNSKGYHPESLATIRVHAKTIGTESLGELDERRCSMNSMRQIVNELCDVAISTAHIKDVATSLDPKAHEAKLTRTPPPCDLQAAGKNNALAMRSAGGIVVL